jgi:hypothetical protein
MLFGEKLILSSDSEVDWITKNVFFPIILGIKTWLVTNLEKILQK